MGGMTMDEYLKRDDALRALEQINPVDYGAMWNYEAHHYVGECLRDCKEALYELPAADVEMVVHARWKSFYRSGVTVSEGAVSSCCDMWNNRASNYCPYCGARMYRKMEVTSDEAD